MNMKTCAIFSTDLSPNNFTHRFQFVLFQVEFQCPLFLCLINLNIQHRLIRFSLNIQYLCYAIVLIKNYWQAEPHILFVISTAMQVKNKCDSAYGFSENCKWIWLHRGIAAFMYCVSLSLIMLIKPKRKWKEVSHHGKLKLNDEKYEEYYKQRDLITLFSDSNYCSCSYCLYFLSER